MMKYFSTVIYIILLLLGSATIWQLSTTALNDNTRSDPKLTLVVSQAIVDYGTVALTEYREDMILGQNFDWYVNMLDILEYDGDFYSYFPVGPSVMAVPFVAVARSYGMDMRTVDNMTLQIWLAAGGLIVLFWLLIGLARLFVKGLASLIIPFVAILGSTMISNMGTGLWSLNFSSIFFAAALIILAQRATKPEKQSLYRNWVAPILLGLLLFLAFFARASAAAFILPVFIYLGGSHFITTWQREPDPDKPRYQLVKLHVSYWLWKEWRTMFKTMVTAAICFLLFLLWSKTVFNTWLPAYYSAERLTVDRLPVWIGMVGNLVSASRGIFVYSPFFLLGTLGVLFFWKNLPARSLVVTCLVWFGVHLWLVSRAAQWWGGWSFGPRLLTDASVGLVLVLIAAWVAVQQRFGRIVQALIIMLFLSFGGVGIYINVVQGLYSQAVLRWYPYVSPTPAIHTRNPLGDMFRWDYAQPFATSRIVCRIEADKVKTYLDAQLPLGEVPLNTSIGYRGEDIHDYQFVLSYNDRKEEAPRPVWVGWSIQEPSYRWTGCPEAKIVFDFGEHDPSAELYDIVLVVYAIRDQAVQIAFNGRVIIDTFLTNATLTNSKLYLTVSRDQINEFGRNEITFTFPDVTLASPQDQRLLGLGLAAFEIQPIGVESVGE
jgi:hypothetical protein